MGETDVDLETLRAFLVQAKLETYAAGNRDASVPAVLAGSHKLEFQRGDFFYRDIYFGGDYFAGQETVYYRDAPLWSMVYAGGLMPAALGLIEAADVYGFLQEALRRVGPQHPYRGPHNWQECAWIYQDENLGDVQRFSGREVISFQGTAVYELHYSGGMILG